tara:strand:- start:338 stop:1063 length:726 start_codon:yes stop_codon:yes gene_type:complete
MSLNIVIPCYNESKRLPFNKYLDFLKLNKQVKIIFVDDGSTDNTKNLVNKLSNKFPKQIKVLSYKKNKGKGNAVRDGFLYAVRQKMSGNLAYLDADLSTSLEECKLLSKKINDKIKFVFGSRISKSNNIIKRKFHRFIIGRSIATIISSIIGVSIYDTQCGCKIMDQKLVKMSFEKAFLSRWLFDVEIFLRLINFYGKDKFLEISREVPLKSWIDTEDSRVKFVHAPRIILDLLIIKKSYK